MYHSHVNFCKYGNQTTSELLKEMPSLIIAVYFHSRLDYKLNSDADSVMDTVAKNGIDKPSSNFSVASCVQFFTNSLRKEINFSFFLTAVG